jgi:hypothetical protein
MTVNLSDFLSSSLAGVQQLDSSQVLSIALENIYPLSTSTSGNYVSNLSAGAGTLVVGDPGHGVVQSINIDSSVVATLNNTLTLTNKSINLTNNTLTTTLSQLSTACVDAALVGVTQSQTLSNKTLTAPTLNTATAVQGSYTALTTFGLRDITTAAYDTRIVSNSSDPLTANHTLALDVANNDRVIKLGGDLTLANNLVTSGNNSLTLTTTGATNVTLPTTGTIATTTDNVATATTLQTARTVALSGDITATGVSFNGSANITLTTAIGAGVIVNADINAAAAIADTKLATIATAGKVANTATTAASANTASAIVARDPSGNFTAGTITATLAGNASTASNTPLLNSQNGAYYLNYNNHTNTPTIPTVGNGTMTITAGTGMSGGGSFTANQSGSTSVTVTNADGGSAQNIFKTVAIAGQTSVTAGTNNTTLTLVAGTGISFATNNTSKAITVNSTVSTAAFQPITSTSSTPPTSPIDGQMWWDDSEGDLYISYNDGNTQQWVQASPSIVGDLSVTTAKLADLSVTTAKLADLSVTTAKIGNLQVTAGKIANDTITATQIAANAIGNSELGLQAVQSVNMASAVSLVIYNSAGTAVKTLYGSGT